MVSQSGNITAFQPLERRTLFAAFILDLSLGTGGFVPAPLGPGAFPATVAFVDAQAAGKIRNGGARVARYNADGTPDTTFAGDGISDAIPIQEITDGALQSDGKIVLVGERNGELTATRFNAD